jgi:GNAT superfamily N-acetyltransferase
VSEEVAVRRATAADANAILQCLKIAFEPYRAAYTSAGFQDTTLTPVTLEQRMQSMVVLVACACDQVVGAVAWSASGDEGHIRGMAVLPQWQGAGVATRLLAAVEDGLRALHCSRVTLHTTAPLQRAISFYRRKGFKPSGKVGDFFGMPLYEYVKQLG